jgi:hypothetical protein
MKAQRHASHAGVIVNYFFIGSLNKTFLWMDVISLSRKGSVLEDSRSPDITRVKSQCKTRLESLALHWDLTLVILADAPPLAILQVRWS